MEGFEKYLSVLRKSNGDKLLPKSIEQYIYHVERYPILQQLNSQELIDEMNKILKQNNNIVIYSAFRNYLAYRDIPKDSELSRSLVKPHKTANIMNSQRFLQSKILSKEEMRRLYDEADDELKLILGFLLETGVRRMEFLNIRFKNVEFIDKEKDDSSIYAKVSIIGGKGGKNRSVFLSKRTTELLKKLKPQTNPDDRIFVFYDDKGNEVVKQDDKLYRILKNHAEKVLGRKTSPHDLRRMMATTLANNGADVLSIAKSLGHSGLGVAQRYINVSDNLSKKTFEKYGRTMLDE